ncbi:hypothetical protein BSKO_01818 [Bryopsis sp. KO-2023]|nr:hypothetical protein BSKO_01818 [Bryopsis sp. KO-2023]
MTHSSQKQRILPVVIMGNLVSSKRKKKTGAITDDDRAILSLKNQRVKLEKERRRLEEIIDKNVIVVRTLVAQKRKDRALLALKKKRLREDQMKHVDTWLLNVEGLLSNIEMARQQNRLVDALKEGAKALKEIQSEVSVEDVEKLMEDNAEAKQYQEQIEEVLTGSLAADVEDELLEELKGLEEQILKDDIDELPTPPETSERLPDVPVVDHTANTAQVEEVEERKEEPLLA